MKSFPGAALAALIVWLLAGCSVAPGPGATQAQSAELLALPAASPAPLEGTRLRAVATTSIIGDVVAHVGGEAVDLVTLMPPGQDPHSFQPTAGDLAAASAAHVIFVNGWGLEEALVRALVNTGENALIVPISAGIEPLRLGDGVDPHVWFSIANVEQWTANAEQIFSTLDPANAATYRRNAEAYRNELKALAVASRDRLAAIPEGRRLLITNHDSLGYLARDYGLQVVGTVIPGSSTLAEPSASDLAGLVEAMRAHSLCTIFTDITVSDDLARTVAAELDVCSDVRVEPLYTGALGPAGSGADSYIGMFHADVERIVQGLSEEAN